MEYISLLGIVAALVLFVIGCLNSVPLTICSSVLSVVIWLFSVGCPDAMSFDGMLAVFCGGVGNIINKYLFLLMFGACFGNIVAVSGIATALSRKFESMINVAPEKYRKLLAVSVVPLLNAIFVYAGISIYAVVFVVVSVARDLFKRMDIPWHLYAVSTIGSATFAATLLPGSPATANVAPQAVLGTSLSSAPVLSLVLTVECVLLGVGYMIFAIRRVERKHEGFLPTGAEIDKVVFREEDDSYKTINLFIATPLLFLPVILMNTIGVSVEAGLLITCVVLLLGYRRRLVGKYKSTVVTGMTNGIMPTMTLAMTTGFASVMVKMPGFNPVYRAIISLSVPAHIKVIILCGTMGFMLGNAIAAETSGLQLLGMDYLIGAGADLAIVHRVTAISSLFAISPHNSGLCNSVTVAKLNHRCTYFHYFMTGPVLGLVVSVTACLLISMGLTF